MMCGDSNDIRECVTFFILTLLCSHTSANYNTAIHNAVFGCNLTGDRAFTWPLYMQSRGCKTISAPHASGTFDTSTKKAVCYLYCRNSLTVSKETECAYRSARSYHCVATMIILSFCHSRGSLRLTRNCCDQSRKLHYVEQCFQIRKSIFHIHVPFLPE